MKATRKADLDLSREFYRQKYLVYGGAGLVLKKKHGWGMKRFEVLVATTSMLWKSCGEDNSVSMMQMLSEETGIEIQNRDGKSWEDLAYLNSSIDPGVITPAKYVYMRKQQAKWVRPQILACILLALHRLHGWGYERGSRFVRELTDEQWEHGMDPQRVKAACNEAYGHDVLAVLDQ